MAKILTNIGSRGFELVRNRIAEILTDEISNQGILFSDIDYSNTKVIICSGGPEDMQYLSIVNVSLMSGSFGERTSYDGFVKATYLYSIDVYCNASNNKTHASNYLSAVKCEKIIGLCFAILDNPIYRNLGYNAKSFIERVKCNSINFRAKNNNDVNNTSMGRLEFEVQIDETVDLLSATVLAEFNTSLKLQETNEGYMYKLVL
jgi:hypothetical protein